MNITKDILDNIIPKIVYMICSLHAVLCQRLKNVLKSHYFEIGKTNNIHIINC